MDIKLDGVPETLLITVKARASATRTRKSLLSDPYAVKIMENVHIDNESPRKQKVSRSSQVGIVERTLTFDNAVCDFLARNPDGAVVSLGCGLDARFERLNLPVKLWIDLDLPETIRIRKNFFREKENYKMAACSMFDCRWMDDIPADKPLLVLAEGVFMYFTEEQLRAMVLEIFRRFPQAHIMFDIMSTFLVKRTKLHSEVRKYNVKLQWGLDKPSDLKAWDERIEIEKVEYFMNRHFSRWTPTMLLFGLVMPAFRKGGKTVMIRMR